MEQWRTVVYHGKTYDNYEVSTEGRVRSLNYRCTGEIKVLKQGKSTKGYSQVRLCHNGDYKQCSVHKLVAYTFPDLIPNDNPQEKTQVNHINEDKTDNRVENLEWVTPRQNIYHGTGIERHTKARSKKVICIETGIIYKSTNDASRKTGLPQSSINACCNGKQESCKGLHFEYVD